MSEKMGDTEGRAGTVNVYDRNCNGCRRHGADVMVAFTLTEGSFAKPRTDGSGVYDLFMDTATALRLRKQLDEIIAQNAEDATADGPATW
jgi:hypothetical protein